MKSLSYNWKKSDYPTETNLKVFGMFIGGGGSTMGYKMAGFRHLGGVEIDKRMGEVYKKNHSPKYLFIEDIREFNQRTNLPNELYDLDILDGSPPCSTFSLMGNREKDWGKEKVFREGQKKQVLDDLVFAYCETIGRLRPKVAILENVPGILAGEAKKYVIGIWERLTELGYEVQLFRLNAATMGIPQARERVFFIVRRSDLGLKNLRLNFNEPPVYFGSIVERGGIANKPIWDSISQRWDFIERGDQNLKFADYRFRKLDAPTAFYGTAILYDNVVAPTLTASGATVYFDEKRNLTETEYVRMSSFPIDFDFCGVEARYVCGMSVPPLMTAHISTAIKEQWF